MSPELLFEINDGIALITLNRPEALNTISAPMLAALGEAYRHCDEDDTVKVVVVTGAGRAFCAGADLSGGDEFARHSNLDFSSCPLSMQAWEVRKPVIAACNGHAIGVGLSIAVQCDLRIVASDAKYGFLQNRRGVVADFAVGKLLQRMIGLEKTFELLVRAVRLSGSELCQWGVAGRAVAADQVLSVALEIAQDMAVNCSPLVMALHKRLLWQADQMSLEEFIEAETGALHHSMSGPDALEGGMAYFEKRKPEWQSSVKNDWPRQWSKF